MQNITEQKAFGEAAGLRSLACSIMWVRHAGHKFPLVRELVTASARGGSYGNRYRRFQTSLNYIHLHSAFCILCVNLKDLDMVRKIWETWCIHHPGPSFFFFLISTLYFVKSFISHRCVFE